MLSRFLKMGNQGAALEDEPFSADKAVQGNSQNFHHFDHSFKAEIHTTSGPTFIKEFGECAYANRQVQVICKGSTFEIIEDVGISNRKSVQIAYKQMKALSWDHANSEVKIEISDTDLVILTMAVSVEFEGELRLRISSVADPLDRTYKAPTIMYVGMFAGATKPKPFQRKRPNLSLLAPSKLPHLHDMRSLALQLHKGSYRPCPAGESRRMELATQHIYEGFNSFPILKIRGPIQGMGRPESILQIKEEMLVFRPMGASVGTSIEYAYADIEDWTAIDHDTYGPKDSGIEIKSSEGHVIYFGVTHIRDVKHSLEFFWNVYQVANGGKVKLGSTHGRPLVTITTLSGEVPSPEAPRGLSEVVDQDGILVRPGARMAPRRTSVVSGVMGSNEPKIVPSENRDVKKHWHKVVMHQGWLLKKGGAGLSKNWIKRYFVLYNTSQGHILNYYSDFTECPLYTKERQERQVVDLSKTTFIRPGSNKADAADTPAHSFDIVTTEREWTLCAESQENVQKWLKLLTRAVDEDVAILPDEDLLFKVKPKSDPLKILNERDYSTTLRVSANGVSVCVPDTSGTQSTSTLSSITGAGGPEKEQYFWVYTDFYKWSLLKQADKLALLVNVFADSSFTRRNEYIFRNKEAVRLATAIEFFIEKFMSVMHIRLETTAGAFDDVIESEAIVRKGNITNSNGGMHQGGGPDSDHLFDDQSDHQPEQELDLLGLDIDDNVTSTPASANASNGNINSGYDAGNDFLNYSPPIAQQQQPQQSLSRGPQSSFDDPFGDDPFGSAKTPASQPQKPSYVDDPFADEMFRAAEAPVHVQAPVHVPVSLPLQNNPDPFSEDPFGSESSPQRGPAQAAAPVASYQSPSTYVDPFSTESPKKPVVSHQVGSYDDTFGANPFGEESFDAPAVIPKVAQIPQFAQPLTPIQIEQHAVWLHGALAAGGGPLFDDGSLQVASKIEVRGSQGRITFYYRNHSDADLNNFEVEIRDVAGLIRCQLSPLPSATLRAGGQTEQQLLVECMQPASPGPQLLLTFTSLQGKRTAALDLPVMITTFNEPLALSGVDFSARWDQLVAQGQEIQEVLAPSKAIIPTDVQNVLTAALKFGPVTGLPDESEFVIYGAACKTFGPMGTSKD